MIEASSDFTAQDFAMDNKAGNINMDSDDSVSWEDFYGKKIFMYSLILETVIFLRSFLLCACVRARMRVWGGGANLCFCRLIRIVTLIWHR